MNLKIAVLPGDGIGPEVTNESIKVLKCIADKYNHKIELSEGPVGAIAIEEYNDKDLSQTQKNELIIRCKQLISEKEELIDDFDTEDKNETKACVRLFRLW